MTAMIRMSVHMHAIRAEETDQWLARLDPQRVDLVMLVAEARADNGQHPFREHDLQALIERRLQASGDGLAVPEMARLLDELEAMG